MVSQKTERKERKTFICNFDNNLTKQENVNQLLLHWVRKPYMLSEVISQKKENHANQCLGLKSFTVYGDIPCNKRSHLIITLEKQLKWAVKACFYKRKFDSSAELEAYIGILPIRFFLSYRIST